MKCKDERGNGGTKDPGKVGQVFDRRSFDRINGHSREENPMDKYESLLNDSKRTIKKWELEFEKTHDRRPGKEDLKSAPSNVTEAYKIYYKIKKKQEQANISDHQAPAEANNFDSISDSCSRDEAPENKSRESPARNQENEPSGCDKNVSVWGAHLNKTKVLQKSNSTSSSPGLNYSKLTEKLMKGAKINIRSSLSRKKSSASIRSSVNSDVNEGSCDAFEESQKGDFCAATVNNVFESPQVPPASSQDEEKEIEDSINRFKPRFISSNKFKQSVTPRGSCLLPDTSFTQVTNRKVDLQWLDECLAQDKPPSPKNNYEDTDIVYSSDDEQTKSCSRVLSDEPEPAKAEAFTSSVKRKIEEEAPAPKSKKSKLELSPLESNQMPEENGSEIDLETNCSSIKSENKPKISKVTRAQQANAGKLERLEQKMASGTANQNFVRINLKKKVFVRGKKTQTGSSYKRQQWKMRQQGGSNFRSKTFTCKRCGEIGHFAKNCMSDKLMSLEMAAEVDGEEIQFPTLEEAVDMAQAGKPKADKSAESADPGDFQLVDLNAIKVIEPPYQFNATAPKDVYDVLKKFGHSSFRPGQELAIMRILSGRSTLVVQSTGAGKSLCYQLPAVVYSQQSPSITIVVSPLVSLMEDQVAHLPSFVKAVCLHTNQTETQRQKVIQSLQSGRMQILLISPETVVSSGPYGLTSLLKQLPPVAFVCIDEAHCVSQWSHNFRPSYLRICKVLRQKMNIRTILGLTATAPRSTLSSIAEHLGIESEEGIIRGTLLPSNLHLSVSRDADRDAALLQLLEGQRFKDFDSIIIYCIRREECERVATLLRTYLKDPTKETGNQSKRRNISWSSEAYHAGLTGARRAAIQKQFMAGKLRIVVATVAFGMGINKSDIRGIIHYNAPRNFESYVQEIGRAGRDGQPAHCHVFLNSEGKDLQELRRFIYSNSVDRHVIRKLLRKIVPDRCSCSEGSCVGHEVALVIESTVNELDMPEENIATLLCHLESHPARWVLEVGTPVYATCTVRCYGGVQQLKTSARQCPALGAALAMQKQESGAQITFPVIEVAAKIGLESGSIKRQLKNLEWDTSGVPLGGKARRSGVLVEFSDLAFHLKMRGDLSESEQDSALEYLYERCVNREHSELQQLQRVHQALLSVSYSKSSACCDDIDAEKSEKLRSFIRDYFEEVGAPLSVENSGPILEESQVRADIRSLILNYRDQTFTARSIARIFHGIASPCFPAEVWGRARKHWRAHLDKDFNALCKMAVTELLALK